MPYESHIQRVCLTIKAWHRSTQLCVECFRIGECLSGLRCRGVREERPPARRARYRLQGGSKCADLTNGVHGWVGSAPAVRCGYLSSHPSSFKWQVVIVLEGVPSVLLFFSSTITAFIAPLTASPQLFCQCFSSGCSL